MGSVYGVYFYCCGVVVFVGIFRCGGVLVVLVGVLGVIVYFVYGIVSIGVVVRCV